MAAVDEVLGVISSAQVKQFREVAKGYTPFRDGDVLFAKITPCMENGKSAIAKQLVGCMGFGSTEFHVLRPSDVITSEYVFWLVRRPAFRSLAAQHFTGTAGQQRVPTSFLENHPCPIPPLPLQNEFAQRVTEIRELETTQAASRQRLESLFQSMLHRAFNGEL
jgi:type I restriction enzyme S subunit